MATIIDPKFHLRNIVTVLRFPGSHAYWGLSGLIDGLTADPREWTGTFATAARRLLYRYADALDNDKILGFTGIYRDHPRTQPDYAAILDGIEALDAGAAYNGNTARSADFAFWKRQSMSVEEVKEAVADYLSTNGYDRFSPEWTIDVDGRYAELDFNLTGVHRQLARRAGRPAHWALHLGSASVATIVRVQSGRILEVTTGTKIEYDIYNLEGYLPSISSLGESIRLGRATLFGTQDSDQEALARANRQDLAEGRYDTFRRSLEKESDMVIPTLPIQETGTRASRRWGIEIETGAGRDLRGTPDGWESKDDGSLESAYGSSYTDPDECPENDHQEMIEVRRTDTSELLEVENPDYLPDWDCGYCGDTDEYDSDDCVELVSPILTSFHSRGLRQICEDLEHAPRTESAGVHVHVEANDLTPEQVRNLILIYDRFEPLIESSYDREERGYCKLRSTRELLSIVRNVDSGKAKSTRDMEKGDRYVTVNLWALNAHGTIEFRAMGPKYNYDHLIRWASFCRDMVNAVANGATPKDALKVKDWAGVTDFLLKFGVEHPRAVGTTDSVPEEEGVREHDLELVGV